jgi:hypothetical protein
MEKVGNITLEYKGITVDASIYKDELPNGGYEIFITGSADTLEGVIVTGNDIGEFISDMKETIDDIK